MAGTLAIFRMEDAVAASPARKADRACLVRIYPASANGSLVELQGPRVTLGRDALCDIEVSDDFTSRVHAMLELQADHWVACDRGSLNGTFINDRRIEQQTLEPGDLLRVGNHLFKFLASDDLEIQYHEAVYEMMTVDALTQTCNRRSFEDGFRREMQRAVRHSRPLSLLLIDVDFFKHINDRFGHLVGDEVLRALGLRLSSRTRGDEILARYGGEEFAVVLPEISLEHSIKLAEEFRELVCDMPFETTRGAVRAAVSVGVAHYDGRSQMSSGELLEAADRCLYEAKRGGRNVVKF